MINLFNDYMCFALSANDVRYYANPPTFKSDSNSATLRFTSQTGSGIGISMAYVLAKYLYL